MNNSSDLSGKVAVITGASGELGGEICRQLHALNAKVHGLGLSRSADPSTSQPWTCDLTDPAQIHRTFSGILNESGKIDILVNNAGLSHGALTPVMNPDDWHRTLDLNLTAAWFCIRAVLKPMMLQRSGSIINISSLAALRPLAGQGAYSAAKGGLEGLTRSIAVEVAGKNIRLNAVAPGFLESRMVSNLTAEKRADLQKKIPLGRLGLLSEAAACVCFLAGPRAAYITGQIFRVDGGLGC